ncbi:MAG: hypothetical protein K2O06_11350 [Acetatifactor sp.]|nr:hypothetical protein [Acetatifactor sp.]
MQIRAITVNAAGMMAAEKGIQGNAFPGVNQAQIKSNNMFGPECRVTISQEGRKRGRQQTDQAGVDGQSVQNAQSAKKERMLFRQLDEAELAKKVREGYRERLNEIDKQITDYNTSYDKTEMSKVVYNASLMEKTIDEQLKLRTAMQDQKRYLMEESQRRVREAQQLAMQSAQYKEEIDENNRDLLTLLKTMEEAEKAEENQENGGVKADGNGNDAANAGNSVSNIIENSADQFIASSINRERMVEEMLTGVEESGRWFLEKADYITRNVLQKSSDIRAALDDPSFTDGQIAEMMQSFQEEMALNYEDVKDFRGFGLQVLRETKEDKLKYMADDPMKGMLQTKKSMMRSAADAVIGEARQSSLDKASQELADEVKKLIDERNDVNRILQDKEEDQEDKKEKEDKIEQENRKEQDDKEEKLENAEEAENEENVENAEYARTQQRL